MASFILFHMVSLPLMKVGISLGSESGTKRQNMFQIVIEGFRNVDFELDEGMLMRLGRVLSVRDHSVPDFDFQHLYEENQNNIIGMYIRQISEMDISDELKAKALGYGMKALLETR